MLMEYHEIVETAFEFEETLTKKTRIETEKGKKVGEKSVHEGQNVNDVGPGR